jgi:hypothetical protein
LVPIRRPLFKHAALPAKLIINLWLTTALALRLCHSLA